MGTRTLEEYQEDVANLGVPDLDDPILLSALNTAQTQVVATRLWNFRLTDATITDGSATVTDLGVIHSAYYADDNGTECSLVAKDKRELQDYGYNLSDTTTGYPDYFYVDLGNTVQSYPLVTFTLRYYANPTEFADATDVSLLPDEMQSALVYQAGGHAFARVGIADMSQMYFGLAKDVMDSFDSLYNNDFTFNLPIRYYNPEG